MDPVAVADEAVRFDDAGLIPVIVQEDETQRVLMLAFMNEEALSADAANRARPLLEPQPQQALAQGRNVRQ